MAETIDIRLLNAQIEAETGFITDLVEGMNRTIVGQKNLVNSLLIGLLSDGHILLEGVPGLAKTLAIKTLASLIDAKFGRLQFTPDLLPADVIGTMIYSQKDESFKVKKGPILQTLYWPTKSTAHQLKCRVHCSKPCKSIKLPSVTTHLHCQIPSWC